MKRIGELALPLLLAAGTALAQPPPESPAADGPTTFLRIPATRPADSVAPTSQPAGKDLLPHIVIDKERSRVAVDCTTLNPGLLLELVACSANREHESVLLVKGRPQNIHLALLLCGFEPGHPAGYDEKTEKPIAPAGDRVDVFVRWTDPKTRTERTDPIEHWMTPLRPGLKMADLTWLFTGSQVLDDGTYLADQEGSVVSISNFSDSVLDLAGLHTRDNQALEFKSNEKTMPAAGTKCQMLLMPPVALRVELDRFGRVSIEGRPAEADKLVARLARHRRCRDDAKVELTIWPDAVEADVKKLRQQLIEAAGFPLERIERRTDAPATQQDSAVFPINDPLAAIDLLTGQYRSQRQAVGAAVAAQRDTFAIMEQRRQLLVRQYVELADYVNRAQRQYRQLLAGEHAAPISPP